MRTYLLFFVSFIFSGLLMGQISFSDDFESYSPGDLIAQSSADWDVWVGGTVGGATDAPVTDLVAAGGNNSLELTGNPDTDIILPFRGTYSSGSFNMTMDVYVPAGRQAYFNFQGNETPGTIWVFQCYFGANGVFTADSGTGGTTVMSNTYKQDEWVSLSFDINLTENLWTLSLDGECLGGFAQTADKLMVSSLNLYPDATNALFYIDNVSFSHSPEAEPLDIELDASIFTYADVNRGFSFTRGYTGSQKTIYAGVGNNGTQEITDFTLEVNAKGNVYSQAFPGANIAPGDFQLFAMDETVTLAAGNDNSVSIKMTDINGMNSDDNPCNNSSTTSLTGFTPAQDKGVLIEEATGTWCQFCPRGDVFMNALSEIYGERFVGIAVHNDDPMALRAWDSGLGTVTASGYPTSMVNRVTEQDPSALEGPFVTAIQEAPLVTLDHGATFDEDTRELTVQVATTFKLPLSGDIRLFVGLTEDGVTGTDAGYAQVNAFSGGAPMGGYEDLPSPVPANLMVYNHVGRYMFTPYQGEQDIYAGETISPGSEIKRTFTYTLPDDWNVENMHIVSAFRALTGSIDNAKSTTIDEAVANGVTGNIDVAFDNDIEVFPNPFNESANIKISMDSPQEVSMQVTDALGKLVAQRNYGIVSGTQIFTFNGAHLANGVYYMKLYNGETFTTKRVVISH